MRNSSQSYRGAAPATWDHIVLPVIYYPILTPGKQAGT